MPVAIDIVDACDGWPEFVFAGPWSWKSCLLPRIGTVPFIGPDLARCVRRVFEQIILSILFPVGDRFHLCVDGNHRVAETIELVLWFALCRLDHHCSSDRPGDCWCVTRPCLSLNRTGKYGSSRFAM